jgi:beta-glucosidase
MRLGEFDPPAMLPWHHLRPEDIAGPRQRAVALTAAQRAIVLLQNRDGQLPLPAGIKRIAVIGPHADRITMNDYNGTAKDCVTALAGLRNRLGTGTEVTYALGCPLAYDVDDARELPPQPQVDRAAALAEAVRAAQAAEVALLFVGTNGSVERESLDRTDLGLPADQQALVEAVVAANPKTVVVLLSAGPLAVPWIKEHTPAILQAWWLGEEGGHAIADVLLGAVNPAGRLPYTMYANAAQVPPTDEYDISKGFTYQYVRGEPLFAFGHGLSYTRFNYRGMELPPTAKEGDVLSVAVTVANGGTRSGDEVVQVYVSEPAGRVIKPKQRLAGFVRITLAPGEQRVVRIPIEVSRLRYWDESRHGFVAEPGTYTVRVGGSSVDQPLTAQFRIDP